MKKKFQKLFGIGVAGSSKGTGEPAKGPYHGLDLNIAKQYEIEIDAKQYDGSSVLVLKTVEHPLNRNVMKPFEKGSIHKIEDVLQAVHGYNDVEYLGDGNFIYNSVKHTVSIKDVTWKYAEFEPIFGHAMIIFKYKNKEEFRLHLTPKGLFFFNSKTGKSYFVKDDANSVYGLEFDNDYPTNMLNGIRGFKSTTMKQSFNIGLMHPSLFTQQLSLKQIIVKAKVTSEPTIEKSFNNLHFVYKFIMEIADENSKENLKTFKTWPVAVRSIDEHITAITGKTVFDQVIGKKKNTGN